jgi:hypothetical protein
MRWFATVEALGIQRGLGKLDLPTAQRRLVAREKHRPFERTPERTTFCPTVTLLQDAPYEYSRSQDFYYIFGYRSQYMQPIRVAKSSGGAVRLLPRKGER